MHRLFCVTLTRSFSKQTRSHIFIFILIVCWMYKRWTAAKYRIEKQISLNINAIFSAAKCLYLFRFCKCATQWYYMWNKGLVFFFFFHFRTLSTNREEKTHTFTRSLHPLIRTITHIIIHACIQTHITGTFSCQPADGRGNRNSNNNNKKYRK